MGEQEYGKKDRAEGERVKAESCANEGEHAEKVERVAHHRERTNGDEVLVLASSDVHRAPDSSKRSHQQYQQTHRLERHAHARVRRPHAASDAGASDGPEDKGARRYESEIADSKLDWPPTENWIRMGEGLKIQSMRNRHNAFIMPWD